MRLAWWVDYGGAWLRNLVSVKALSAVLSAFGSLWLCVEIVTYFFPTYLNVAEYIRGAWVWFGVTGLLFAVYMCKPRRSVSHRLSGRDVNVEIAIGDVFAFPGALIIGSNTTFDTRISRELIAKSSVQGQFTNKYYGDEAQLDKELSAGLRDEDHEPLTGARLGKTNRYPIGTCVRLNPRERTAYFLAIAEISEHGVASSSFDNLKQALPKLWAFIGERGAKEPLVTPVLGTGFSRLAQTREEVVREIIKSFVAACSERTFSDKLTIVVSPHDVAKCGVSLDELGSFLRYQCSYNDYRNSGAPQAGTPVL